MTWCISGPFRTNMRQFAEVYPPEAFWIMIGSMLGSGLWIVHEVLTGGGGET